MAAFRIISGLRKLSINNSTQNIKLLNVCQRHFLSSKVQKETVTNETDKKKKTPIIPKITLISPDESIQILTIQEAQKISVRRNLKLVKLVDLDSKTQRPVFKLMTGADYHASDLKQREAKKAEKKTDNSLKGEKLLLINARISEHDLESRIKKIARWLGKRHEVRVVINGDVENMEPSENVYKTIEEQLKTESRILQKRTKGNELKFQIIPPKNISNSKSNTEEKSADAI